MLIQLMKLTNPTEHTMKEIKLYIGLDVHKNSIQCGIAHAGRSKPEVYAKWGGANLSAERGLNKLLKKFGPGARAGCST